MTAFSRLLTLPFFVFLLFCSSCAAPMYREIKTPLPGGGFHVQRIRLAPREAALLRKLNKQNLYATGQKEAPVDDGSYWEGDGVEGSPSLRISLSEQKVYLLKGGREVGASPISSGRESHATRPGKFKIMEKDIDHKSNLYGDYVDETGTAIQKEVDVRKDKKPKGATFDGANMRYFMRVTGAIGMHEGYLPGYPASHGCIRLPGKMAEIFYHNCEVGTPVEIVP